MPEVVPALSPIYLQSKIVFLISTPEQRRFDQNKFKLWEAVEEYRTIACLSHRLWVSTSCFSGTKENTERSYKKRLDAAIKSIEEGPGNPPKIQKKVYSLISSEYNDEGRGNLNNLLDDYRKGL